MQGVLYGQEGGDKASVYAGWAAWGCHRIFVGAEVEQGGAAGVCGFVPSDIEVYDGYLFGRRL